MVPPIERITVRVTVKQDDARRVGLAKDVGRLGRSTVERSGSERGTNDQAAADARIAA